MGIDLRVETENGDLLSELLDPRSLMRQILHTTTPSFSESVCLRFIDEYGDTTFNQLQLPILLRELRLAVAHCKNLDARAHGEKLASIVKAVNGKVHTYVKFVGD
jgi:hypothetical protein